MKGPVLVVLAAGIGSRYGGVKQIDRVGQNGEVLLDFSVYDARRAGFAKVVFIIRHEIEKDFKEVVLNRLGASLPWEVVFQELDSLIPAAVLAESRRAGRVKPWGTAHALLCAEDKIDAPFAIINADDFYGREAFAALGQYLASPDLRDACIVPYALSKTLSPRGTVTRGVCEIEGGYLKSVDELTAIAREGDRIFNTVPTGERRELSPDTPVSMNCWGFPPSIFPDLRRYFENFLQSAGNQPRAECYLPLAADWFIKAGLLKFKVLNADSAWFGVTYKEDRESAVNHIAGLVKQGVYPASLWGSP
jgi:dTDP-glucose pyrophosphorylase